MYIPGHAEKWGRTSKTKARANNNNIIDMYNFGQAGGGRRAGRPGDARGRCAARQWQEALRGAPAPAAFSGMVHVHAYLALNHTCEHEAPPNTTNPRPKWQSPCMGVAAGAGIAARLPLAAGACVCARVSFP